MTDILKAELKRLHWETVWLKRMADRLEKHPEVFLEVSPLLNRFNRYHSAQKTLLERLT